MSSQSMIIPRTAYYPLSFAADPAYAFGFSATNVWVNAVSALTVPGASEITSLFELVRVAKVIVTYIPGNHALDWGSNTITTGTRNIPWIYECFDPCITATPSIAGMVEAASTITRTANVPFSRTIYPVLNESSLAVNTGTSRKDIFVRAGSDVPFDGWSFIADLSSVALTYDIGALMFKIFYECRCTR